MMTLKPGGATLVLLSIVAIAIAAVMNMYLGVHLEFGIGAGLGIIMLYAWRLQRRGEPIPLLAQLQRVEWGTLMFFVGVITGVAALNHVGWLSYVARLHDVLTPVWVNVILGAVSGLLDNVPVEAMALLSDPGMPQSQWALNALLVGVGGSLTVIGSAAGIMVMSIDRSYTFAAHLKFFPAILANFVVSLGAWYVQYRMLR
jgi:Na+/H+ antiporter NhaD/arsenite permease-like protein